MNTINTRINLIIKKLELNNNSFATKLNISPTVIYNIVSARKSKPSFDVLEKILLSFDNINSDWLIRGKGEMFIKPDEKANAKEEIRYLKKLVSSQEKTIQVLEKQINLLEQYKKLDSDNK